MINRDGGVYSRPLSKISAGKGEDYIRESNNEKLMS